MNRPSPFFTGVIVTLIALVLLVWSLLQNAVYAADLNRAPVVQPEGDVLVQIGWYTYEALDDAVILYCVPQGKATLTCAMFVMTPKGNGIVLVEGIVASEAKT